MKMLNIIFQSKVHIYSFAKREKLIEKEEIPTNEEMIKVQFKEGIDISAIKRKAIITLNGTYANTLLNSLLQRA